MARRGGEVLEDVEYSSKDDVNEPGGEDAGNGAAPSGAEEEMRYRPLSQRSKADIFRTLKRWVLADLENSQTWREQATDDMAFVAGDQLTQADKQYLDDQGRPHVVFNRTETIIKAIAGMEINGRHEIQFLPRNNDDTEVNEVLTAASKWMADGCDAEDEQSAAFEECLVAGIGATETRFSFEDDPEGQALEEQIDCREMFWERSARKKNLVDRRRCGRIRRMPITDGTMMFPGKSRVALDAVWANSNYLDKTTLKSIEERRIRDGDDTTQDPFDEYNEVTIVVIQWIEKEFYWRVADEQTNQITELTDDQYHLLQQRMNVLSQRLGQKIEIHARRAVRKCYYQAFLGNELLGMGKAPLGSQFSWAFITGGFDKKKRVFYGLIRAMRDPQMWSNKFFSQIMQIMNATAKGGIMAETDAFEDQEDAEKTYARPESITWVAPDALSGAKPKIMPKPGQGDASAYVQLLTFSIGAIKDVTGVNLELLGQQDQNQPGILEHMRKQAGMTVLATQFDSMRRFLKIVGRQRLYLIQNRMSDGRLIRVVGDEYTQAIPLVKEKTTGTYDVIVADAPTSPNQKEATWAILQPMLVAFKDAIMGNPVILTMILEYSPLPAKLVAGIKRIIMQNANNPEEQQYQEAMKKATLAKLTAGANKDQATAEMNNAKAGASSATAAYDLAMAQNLLAKNDMDGFNHHIQAMAEAAKAEKNKADAAKSQAQAHREVIGLHQDIQNGEASQFDHTDNLVKVHKAVTDRMKAHTADRDSRENSAINHISALAGAHRDIAAAHRDRVGAVVDQRPEPKRAT